MPVTKYFIIGNLSVPSTWLAMLAAIAAAYLAVRIMYGKVNADLVSDAFFWLIIIWKFSVVLTDFSTVRQVPLAIIYFDGGSAGFILGLLFILFKYSRGTWTQSRFNALVTAWVVTQSVFQIGMALLNPGYTFASIWTILLFSVMLLIFIFMKLVTAVQWIFIFAAFHTFTGAMQPDGLVVLPLLSAWIISLYFMYMSHKMHRTEEIA